MLANLLVERLDDVPDLVTARKLATMVLDRIEAECPVV